VYDRGSNAVYTYDSPSHGSLGSPVARTVLAGPLDAPAQFAFSSDMNALYVANNSDNNSLYEFAFPAGKAISSISVGGLPFGVALFPKQFPHERKRQPRIVAGAPSLATVSFQNGRSRRPER
jgi:DNA-binding beta-propeller fold protein YncE